MEYVQGVKELVKKLQRLSAKDAKASIRKGTRAGKISRAFLEKPPGPGGRRWGCGRGG